MLEEFKKKRKEKSSICAKNTKKPAVPTIATGFRFFKMSNFTAEILKIMFTACDVKQFWVLFI